MSSPFDLNASIAAWRRRYEHDRSFLPEDIRELEQHVRDQVAALVEQGRSQEEAFLHVMREMGEHEEVRAAYQTVRWGKLQRTHSLGNELTARFSMFKNYLKTTFRSLWRKKGYSFINIAGLTLGLASCLIIFQYVAFEYSFDRFHEHEPDLYRVLQVLARGSEELGGGSPHTSQSMGPALIEAVPELQRFARLHAEYGGAVVSNPAEAGKVFEEQRAYYADPAFLEMFSFPLVAGNRATALEPGTMLISRSAVRKYFGDSNPIGQVLDWTGNTEQSYQVRGVLQDIPAQSHLQFDFLLPIQDLLRTEQYVDEPEGGWSWNNFGTYIQLLPGVDRSLAERKMVEVFRAQRGETLRQQGFKSSLSIQPIRSIHLDAEVGRAGPPETEVIGNHRTVYFFTVIGLVTLLIALVNYINLATARALDRAKEVGVRKVVGAQRRQLMVQFLCESALTNLLAAVLAIAVAVTLTPVVNALAETTLSPARWMDVRFWIAFLVTLGACTLLAGLYPAFVLSSFKPVAVLKGKAGSFSGQLWLRRGLVVLQFAASVVLIAGTVVVYDQLSYMRRMDLGLDLEQVLTVQAPRILPGEMPPDAAMATFLQELRRLPSVRQAATSSSLPGQGYNWNGAALRKATDDPANAIRGVATYIDTSFASLFGLERIAGNEFADITIPEDDEAPWPVMLNETAVKTLGYATPADAVDQALDIGGYDARVVGVYKDFNWSSAHEEQQSIVLGPTEAGRHVSLRLATDDLSGTISRIEAAYSGLFPGNVFQHAFVDEAFDQQYRNDERFAALFTFFAALAIVIACLGLFGLASFTAQQRTKEIGVRKVLGASAPGLIALLSKDFLKLVIAAVAIACPIAYIFMQRWLEGFAYQIDLGPGVFLLAGSLALLIALATVSYQAVKAALADPVKSLRYE